MHMFVRGRPGPLLAHLLWRRRVRPASLLWPRRRRGGRGRFLIYSVALEEGSFFFSPRMWRVRGKRLLQAAPSTRMPPAL